VKSMLGESIDASLVGERGLIGDRGFALLDQETGMVASAKNPRRWSMLFECRAAYVEEPRDAAVLPPVEITGPAGETVRSDDPGVHESLSRIVGRAVRLETRPPEGAQLEQYRPPVQGITDEHDDTVTAEAIAVVAPGTFFDAAPLHVVTTATLDRLHELSPESSFSPARFRPNAVVTVDDTDGFVENDWVNHSAALGAEVRAAVFLAAPRCVMTTLAQTGLPRDNAVLQTVARHNRFDIPGLGPSSCVGVYALVSAGGTIRCGDPVVIT
jgi:MOSC domain-containing protein